MLWDYIFVVVEAYRTKMDKDKGALGFLGDSAITVHEFSRTEIELSCVGI